MTDTTIRRLGIIAPILATAALGGCSLGPDFVRPVPALPSTWQGAPSSGAATAALDTRWWRAFGDPRLDALEDRAATGSIEIALAAERVEAARIARGAARADALPTLSGGASYSRERVSAAGLSAIVAPLLGESNVRDAPKGVDFNLYSVGVSAGWEPDIWGKRHREVEAAQATLQATSAAARGARLVVQAEVARTYFQLLGLREEQRLSTETLQIADQVAALSATLRSRGLASAVDIVDTASRQREIRGELADLDRQITGAERALAMLVGAAPDTVLIDRNAHVALPAIRRDPVRLPSDVARRRPDIVQAEAQLHAATALIGAAQADFYPSISLTGLFSLDALKLADLGWDARSTSVGPALTLPIFSGGRLQRQLELRESEQRSAVLSYRQSVLNAWREVEDAIALGNAVSSRGALADDEMLSRRHAVSLITMRFGRGDVAAAPVLEARTAAIAAERLRLRLIVASAIARIQLASATGG